MLAHEVFARRDLFGRLAVGRRLGILGPGRSRPDSAHSSGQTGGNRRPDKLTTPSIHGKLLSENGVSGSEPEL